MRAALISEYRKIITTRLWWVLLIVMGLYMAFLALSMAFSLHSVWELGDDPSGAAMPVEPDMVISMVYSVAASLGYVFPVSVGAIAVTQEFRHKTITPTLLAEPSRTVLVLGKLAAGAVIGVLFGVVGTAATALAGGGLLALLGHPTFLGEPEVLFSLGRSVVALAVWCAVGVGFGLLVTNQIAAIIILLAFTQFVEPVLRIALSFISWGGSIASYFPGAAGEAIMGGSFYTQLGNDQALLGPWAGFALLVGYALVLALLGRLTTLRRDIT